MLRREHWTVDQLLDTKLSLAQAQAVMDRGMAAAAKAATPPPPPPQAAPTAHGELRLRPLADHAKARPTHHHRKHWRRHGHAPAHGRAPSAAAPAVQPLAPVGATSQPVGR
jgi:hypothetical protein